MAMRWQGTRRLGLAAGVVVAAVIAMAATTGHARISSSCNPGADTAEFGIDDPGTAVRASVGYATGANDQIGHRYKGSGPGGATVGGSGSCGHNPGEQWGFLTVRLGGKADRLRQDALKPRLSAGFGAMPVTVEVDVYGGGGPDTLFGHAGRDDIFAQGGDDLIDVRGGAADLADCGPGEDVLLAGANDVQFDCETLKVR